MLVLQKAGLVYLANPKTATQSLRATLGPFAKATPKDTGAKHINAAIYARKWAAHIAADLGAAPQTFAVMREPLEHLNSWYRYRQRDALRGHENGTHDISFATFIEAVLHPDPPAFARIGRQARFLGFLGGAPPVQLLFDYAQLDLLIVFLNERLGANLALPNRNVSPPVGAGEGAALPEALMAQLRHDLAVEFALYARVAEAGVLETAANGQSTP